MDFDTTIFATKNKQYANLSNEKKNLLIDSVSVIKNDLHFKKALVKLLINKTKTRKKNPMNASYYFGNVKVQAKTRVFN